MEKINILHLLTTSTYSGAENVVCTIIENEDKGKYNAFYCSPDGSIKDILKKRNIQYIPLKKFSIKNIKKAIKEYNIDIVHAHDFKASVLASMSGFKGKIISHIHCNPDFIKNWNIFSIIYSHASKKFSNIIFVSEAGLDGTVFRDKIKDKAIVINNVVDKQRIIDASKKTDIKEEYDIVFLGRLIELKKPELVIEIIKNLKESNPNIKACIIGDGILYNKCKELINSYNLNKNIAMIGFSDNPFPYVKKAKIALMPSKYEGLGLSAIECMILNVPVLNSGAGGLKDLFKNNKEFICNNIDDYIKKIKLLLNNKKEYNKYKTACSKIIEKYVNTKNFIDNINKTYARKK